MQFTILNSGLSDMENIVADGFQLQLTTFAVGTGYNYIPTASMTGLQGSTLFVGAISSFSIVGPSTVQYTLILDQAIGNFNFGEVGIFTADGTCFALSTLPQLQEKIANSAVTVGNLIKIQALLSVTNAPQNLSFPITNVTYTNLPEIQSVDDLVSPVLSQADAYSCVGGDELGNAYVILAKPAVGNSGAGTWSFGSYDTLWISSTVSSATSTSLQSTGIGNYLNDVSAGKYVLMITSGINSGYARAITNSTNNSISWVTSFTAASSGGDTFEIYKSNSSVNMMRPTASLISPTTLSFLDNGNTFIVSGTGTNVTVPDPSMSMGLWYRFVCSDSIPHSFTTPSGVIDFAGGISSNTVTLVDASFELTCDGTTWWATAEGPVNTTNGYSIPNDLTVQNNADIVNLLTAGTVGRDVGHSPNVIRNSSGFFGLNEWTPSDGSWSANSVDGQNNGSYLVYSGTSTTATLTQIFPQTFSTFTLSGWVFNGTSSGTSSVNIIALNSSEAVISTLASLSLASGLGWTYLTDTFSGTLPTGTTSLQIQLYAAGLTTSSSNIAFAYLKLENNSDATTYSLEGDLIAAYYSGGAPINNSGATTDLLLQPGQSAYIYNGNTGLTSLPLHIACGNNQMYDISLYIGQSQYNNVDLWILPNNQTYTNAFSQTMLNIGDSSTTAGAETVMVQAAPVYENGTNPPKATVNNPGSSGQTPCFWFDTYGGFSDIAPYLKDIKIHTGVLGSTGKACIAYGGDILGISTGSSIWQDSSTAYTSLGTIWLTGSGGPSTSWGSSSTGGPGTLQQTFGQVMVVIKRLI